MSKEKTLMFEPIGQRIIVDPYYPPSIAERKAGKVGLSTDIEVTSKNRFWPETRQEMKHKDFDSHPCQGRVVAIGMGVTRENPIEENMRIPDDGPDRLNHDSLIGTIKVGDWIAFRVSSGEELVYNGIVYRALAPYEILMKYLDDTER